MFDMSAINIFTEKVGLPDRAIDVDDIPWVPVKTGHWFKPLRFDLATGTWTIMTKISPSAAISRHRHTGSVFAYTIQGEWRYLERTWIAKAGTVAYEPPGDVHTLVVNGEEDMITLFIIVGCNQYLDDNDQIIGQDDVFTRLKLYQDYCSTQHIPFQELCY
ncbi:UNVERIFIED_CONTAM: 2,4'-dihydroxyacetophenone dioxygenase [Brevibacillus sp. OAP136]